MDPSLTSGPMMADFPRIALSPWPGRSRNLG